MARTLRTLVVLVALFEFCLSIQLPPGHTYIYDYVTTVRFNEPDATSGSQARRDVGFTLTCKVALVPMFTRGQQTLVKLTVTAPRLDGTARPNHKTQVAALTRFPVLAELDGVAVRQVYTAERDPAWCANIKKGILALLQVQRKPGSSQQVDASGECDVTYKVDGLRVVKTKTGCKPVTDKNQFTNVHHVLGVAITSSIESKYTMSSDDVLQSVTSQEQHVSRVNLRDSLAARVMCTQSLTLEKKSLGAVAIQASSLEEAAQVVNSKEKLKLEGSTLATSYERRPCDVKDCDEMAAVVTNLRAALEDGAIATVDAGAHFLSLVTSLRYANQEAISDVLSDKKNENIMPQLVEAVTAAQTPAGQAALMGLLNFDEEYYFKLQESYLLAAAFSTHPPEAVLRDLYELYKRNVKSPTLRESIGGSLGAVMYTYCQTGDQCKHKVIEDARKLIVERVQTCTDHDCRAQQLHILGNAGLRDTLAVLLKYAEWGGETRVQAAAIQALRRLEPDAFDEKVKTAMRSIYHQRRRPYDNTVRTQALMVLLTHAPTDTDVHEVLQSTTDPDETEHAQYVQQRLLQMAQRDGRIMMQLERALTNITMRNYHVLAPKGKGLAFKESMAEMRGLSVTYDMYVQNSKGGIMKRSGMDVDLVSDTSTLPLYSGMASRMNRVEKLRLAILDSNIEEVEAILKVEGNRAKELCAVEVSSSGNALHYAASLGHVDIVAAILSVGVDINNRREQGDATHGCTALHEAVDGLHTAAVRFLVQHGADVNTQDGHGLTPMHVACRSNSVQLVKQLFEAGADLGVQDHGGNTPLLVCIVRSATEAALLLLTQGADVQAGDRAGQSPLHYAAEWGCLQLVEVLVARGAALNHRDSQGNTPLHLAPQGPVFDFLVEHGADAAIRNEVGQAARITAIRKEQYKNIDKALVGHGAKTNTMPTYSARLTEHQLPPSRIFSPGPPAPETELRSARTNMLKQIQQRTGFQGATVTQPTPEELRGNSVLTPRTARPNGKQSLSPLVLDGTVNMADPFYKATSHSK